MTSYFTAVSNELLADFRTDLMPDGFRLKREVGRILSPHAGMTLVEFEDDEAPPELDGRTVTPTFQSHYDGGTRTHTTITARDVDPTPWQVVP